MFKIIKKKRNVTQIREIFKRKQKPSRSVGIDLKDFQF